MRIFVSYSHQDEAWKNKVCTHLGVLAREGLEVWDDRRIAGGDDWLPAIEQAIAGCDAALLLISAHFLTSKFILGEEIPALLKRREAQGVRVIPVMLSDCAWRKVSWLKPIQAQPTDGKPLDGMTRPKANSALKTLAESLHDLARKRPGGSSRSNPPPEKIDLTHLPAGAEHFLGREAELAALDEAWASAGKTAVVELIAPGGTGKTALVKRWLDRNMQAAGWRGAVRVYAWSFYSQGAGDARQASEDHFLAEALAWFGVDVEPTLNPWDKGRRLADAVATRRTLLILDGVEPLQYPPGPLAGELRAPGLKALLTHLASAGQPGLCVLSSREFVKDLAEWVGGSVQRIDLGNLNEPDGARLLHTLGAKRAGAADIGPDDAELQTASREVRGHALTLSLLGAYLALAYEGDIRQRDQVQFSMADAETAGGHAFRVIAAYERWFAAAGEAGARQLAALRLLGFFDRPASAAGIDALRAAPAIAGLTEALQGIAQPAWRATLKRLESLGLIAPPAPDGSLDAHPLVREYLAETLKTRPEAWQEGHRRLYEQLKASAPHRPEGLDALQPLYQAVVHGCQADLWQQACDEVYVDRILRGRAHSGYYSTRKLGAFGADLGAVACFFVEHWRRSAPALSVSDQAWLLNQAALRLRALGRLEEALGPLRAGVEMAVTQEDWEHAATGYGNLSELQLRLGWVAEAVANAGRAVDYADRSGDAFQRLVSRTALADALHQQGQAQAAAQTFAEAEAMQAERQPKYPLLYSLQGFRYCDLLLAGAVERQAWQGPGEGAERCGEVAARAAQEKGMGGAPLLDFALRRLTLARCALCADLLQGSSPGATAQSETEQAVAGLRATGAQEFVVLGLLTRAWLHHRLGKTANAAADLIEAEQIARRGSMKLHLADIALTRARLFHDRAVLAEARRLIEECGYGRRLPELEDAEADATNWPAPPKIHSSQSPETPPMNTISSSPAKRFKIALSFAGERRPFVEAVAKRLADHVGQDRVLYDQYYEAEFARPDLDTYLQRLYHLESETIAVFLCKDYEHKEWCGLEWRVVRDLIKKRQAADIMPLRFDDTEVPGLFSIDGYVWIGNRGANEIADVILTRLGIAVAATPAPSPIPPSTPAASPTASPKGRSPAAAVWAERLEFLRVEEAKAASAAERFAIKKHIEEAQAKLKELS